jgi:mono/diheme cytochrome c family protein
MDPGVSARMGAQSVALNDLIICLPGNLTMNKTLSALLLACLLLSCHSRKGSPEQAYIRPDPAKENFEESPLVSPQESLNKMIVEEGFEVQLVAAEPQVSSPVAMNFDNKGRMWVIEMDGYMTNVDGTEENDRNGKIVILEDRNRDGRIDRRKVFIDSLVLPRALCLIENGILVAEPPRLWFIEITNDKPGKKILIDEAYTEGGNVEAQANGLFRAMDNWIYSGGSDKRYRKVGEKWLTERTHLRGQWGISQDDYGRLYYNNNSQNLLGDYFLPGLGAYNENMQRVRGFNERIVSDNRVYPGRPTPGVNRGYKDNVLDADKKLTTFTAACGPLLYRGERFGPAYYNNVFVAEPAANLIKRNVLNNSGFFTGGRQAYQGREFLVSMDERFRPVSLYDGPDGAVYVVDMYRGIIQHKSFLTDYLKTEIAKRSLEDYVNCGRIYKIIPKGSGRGTATIPSDPDQLVALLSSPNGWMRDKAQQLLIDGRHTSIAHQLRAIIRESAGSLASIHALWTLEGLGLLRSEEVISMLNSDNWNSRAQALSTFPSHISSANYRPYIPVLQKMTQQADTLIAPYIAFQARTIRAYDQAAADGILMALLAKYPASPFLSDAVISNLKGREDAFLNQAVSLGHDTNLPVLKQLKKVIEDIKSNAANADANLLRKQFPRGASLFRTTCQPCHGADGNGVRSLAPPLNRSEWVTGDKTTLIAIILHGLTGPVTVNGKLYQAPEINGDMPGLASNKDIVDEDIAQLSSFLRQSWSNQAEKISREEVIAIRKKFADRKTPFTALELKSGN